jgi:hypothetical protein
LGVLLLWLVLGGVPLPPHDVLQPPGHELHQVSQELYWVNFELGGVPLNACQKKVLNLGQWNLVRICIHTDTKKNRKPLVLSGTMILDFKDFFVTEIFSRLANCLFFSCQKACQTNNLSLRTKFCQNQPKGKPHKQEKSHDAATYMKVAMKVFPGLTLCGMHCTSPPGMVTMQENQDNQRE